MITCARPTLVLLYRFMCISWEPRRLWITYIYWTKPRDVTCLSLKFISQEDDVLLIRIDMACQVSEWVDSMVLEINSLYLITEIWIFSPRSHPILYQQYLGVRSQATDIAIYKYMCKRLTHKKPAGSYNGPRFCSCLFKQRLCFIDFIT